MQKETSSTKTRAKAKEVVKMPYLVAADIGFGELKLLSSEFPTPRSLPSAVLPGAKPSSSKLFGLETIDHNALIVTTEDGTFHVGQQAMNIPTNATKRTQVRDRSNDISSRVLFQTGIALGVPHEAGDYNVYVVTGLPNDDYDLSIKKRLEEFLNYSFDVTFHLSETRTITKRINVVGVEILRQPEGSVTYNQFVFDKENFLMPSENARSLMGVIDFGHFTTDYALFRDGIIIEDQPVNGSTVGVTEAYNRLRRRLVVKFDEMGYDFGPTEQDLDSAVRTGKISYLSQEFDVQEEVKQTAAEVGAIISKAVLDSWGNETNRLELIITSGGGSILFGEAVAGEFANRKKQGFQQIEYPQYSNVLGFYMYGCITQSDDFSEEEIYESYVSPVFSEEK